MKVILKKDLSAGRMEVCKLGMRRDGEPEVYQAKSRTVIAWAYEGSEEFYAGLTFFNLYS